MRSVALVLALLLGTPTIALEPVLDAGDGELVRMNLPFAPITPTGTELARWVDAPHWDFANPAVTITFEQTPLNCPSGYLDEGKVVRIILKVVREGGTEYWAAAEPSCLASGSSDHLEARWNVVPEEFEAPTAEAVASASDVPMFVVAYETSWWRGRRTTVNTAHRLVIDRRQPRPMMLARLSSLELDGFCTFAEPRPSARCAWDDTRKDFRCTEHFDGAERETWLTTGDAVAPGSSAQELGDWVAAEPRAPGTGVKTVDTGAVRLIAELRGRRRGRRMWLFGASDTFDAPFFVVVRDGTRSRTVKAAFDTALRPTEANDHGLKDRSSVPLGEYRLADEPPDFTLRALTTDGQTRLFEVMASIAPARQRVLYHVAIEETDAGAIAGAVRVASSGDDEELDFLPLTSDEAFDACDFRIGGFARASRIRLAPLRIRYDVEPVFELTGEGRSRNDESCGTFTDARWQPGVGFALTHEMAPCSKTRFRAVHIDADGRLEVRSRIEPPHQER